MDDPEVQQRRVQQAEYVAGLLANCLRDCLRAIVAEGGPDASITRAARDFRDLTYEMARYEDPNYHQLVALAVDELRPVRPDYLADQHAVDYAILSIVGNGIRYLTELSAHDAAAKGRASRRRSEFLRSLPSIEHAAEREKHYHQNRYPPAMTDKERAQAATRRARDLIAEAKERQRESGKGAPKKPCGK